MIKRYLPVVCAPLAFGVPAAHAAVQTYNYDITASGFTYVIGPMGDTPIDPVTLDFSVTLDPSASYSGTTLTGLNVTSFNLPYLTGGFTYAPGNVLTVATQPNGLGSFYDTPSSYGVFIDNPFSSPYAYFIQTDANGAIFGSNVSVSVSSVPEPATWAMLLIGFAGLGFAGYRRAPKSAATLAAA